MTTLVWKGKQDIHMLMNMHNPPDKSNFCNNNGKSIKPAKIEGYHKHVGYVDKFDRIANSNPSNTEPGNGGGGG
jgi:hypothetical protein